MSMFEGDWEQWYSGVSSKDGENGGKDFGVRHEIKALFYRSRFLGFRGPILDTLLHDSAQESVSNGANFYFSGRVWAFLPGKR